MNAVPKNTVSFALESMERVWDEIQPLLRAHWEEIAHFRDIPLKPRYERYWEAQAAGRLRIFTVRVDSLLVGYAIYFVDRHLHYGDSLQAFQDILFVHYDFRGTTLGVRLIRHADRILAQQDVQVVVQHVKAKHDFGPLLERMGYELMDKLYVRRLDGL